MDLTDYQSDVLRHLAERCNDRPMEAAPVDPEDHGLDYGDAEDELQDLRRMLNDIADGIEPH